MSYPYTAETGGTFRAVSPAYLDANGNTVDPATLSLSYVNRPLVALTTVGYNPGAIVKDSLGSFHYDFVNIAVGGLYQLKWVATGVDPKLIVVDAEFFVVNAGIS